MDTPVSKPAARSSFILRGIAVAALLLALVSTTVYAQASRNSNQQGTPASGSETLSTAAAVPADATAYVAINVDPNSEQFQTSADLSGSSGLIDLFNLVADLDLSDADDISGVFEGVGATEIGVGIPAVSAGQIESLATATTGDVPEVADQDVRVVLATADPEAAFTYLTEEFPALAAGPNSSTEQSTYAGVDVVSIGDGASLETTVNFALIDDLIVITPTIEGIESSIDTAQGTTDSIASTGKFQDVTGQLGGESMLFAFSDNGAILSDPAYTDLLTEMGIDPSVLAQFNVYSGLQVAADADAPGFRVNTVSFPNTDGGATPAAMPSFSSDLTSQVPDDTMVYLGGNNLGQVLGPIVSIALASSAVTDVVGEVAASPAAVATVTASGATPESDIGAERATMDEGTPVASDDISEIADVVASFLNLLTGEYVVAIQAPQITALSDPNSLYVLFASGIEGGPLVDSLLSLATDSLSGADSGVTVTSEMIDGNTVYTATTGADATAITFSYGVVDGQVLVGLGDSVQSFLAGPDVSLADNPQFQETFAALGRAPEEGSVVYLDFTTLLPLVQTGGELLGGTGSVLDNDPNCAQYDSQSDAQSAYDEDPYDNSNLDLDFDGEACEDFFAPAGTPEPMLSDVDFSGVVSYGQVTYQGDGFTASEGLFLLSPAS